MRRSLLTAATLALLSCVPARADGDVVKLGILTDLAGPDSDMAGNGSIVAARMAVEDAGGKAGGKRVEIISADFQRKPDIAASVATKWYDTEGVDAIFDIPLSSAALAVQEVARRRDKVVVFATAASSDLTGKACSPTGFHWVYDTMAVANGTAAAVTREVGKTWYFLTADYAFGHALQRDATAVIKANGGQVAGASLHPVQTPDLSSFLLQAQVSKAKVIGLANSAGDTTNSIRQANEFGIQAGGQSVAALLAFITDIHSLGLPVAKGIQLTESFYWDLDEGTRAFATRFEKLHGGRKPTMIQAGIYSAVSHYLKAVDATKSTDGPKVAAKMREIPVKDFMTDNAKIWASGWVERAFYLFKVKTPAESKGPWDYYNLVAKVAPEQAKPPGSDDACPLMKR